MAWFFLKQKIGLLKEHSTFLGGGGGGGGGNRLILQLPKS